MIWKSLGQAAISSFGAGAGRAAVEHVLHGGGKGRRGTLVLKKTIGPMKVYFDREWEEYIVKPQGSREIEEWYHTDDREDAYNTAKVMAQEEGHRARGRRASGRRAIEYAELTTAQERALIDAEIAKFPAEFSLPYEEGKFRFEKWPGSFVTSKNEVSLNLQGWDQSARRWEGRGRYTPAQIRRMGIKGSGARGRRASGRRAGREINPYSKRYTFAQFKKRYFKSGPVPNAVAKEFWSDFRYAFQGGLQKYIDATTGQAARGRRNCVCD